LLALELRATAETYVSRVLTLPRRRWELKRGCACETPAHSGMAAEHAPQHAQQLHGSSILSRNITVDDNLAS